MSISVLHPSDFSPHHLGLLHEIPEPPKQLWYEGALPPKDLTLLAVVGSRAFTSYGKQVIEHLISGLKGYPVGIVSGLALGVDALAHETAIKNGLYTLAVPGSGLSDKVLYPTQNRPLARKILESGGGLLSELSPDTKAATWTFPMRNRIMAGMCPATILIEAGEKSGTLITARLAVDYNRELMAVPGSIFSKNSHGTHQFLKLGATIVTDASDILTVLNMDMKEPQTLTLPEFTSNEALVIKLLHEPTDRDSLLRQLPLATKDANILLMTMELKGYIKYVSPHYQAMV